MMVYGISAFTIMIVALAIFVIYEQYKGESERQKRVISFGRCRQFADVLLDTAGGQFVIEETLVWGFRKVIWFTSRPNEICNSADLAEATEPPHWRDLERNDEYILLMGASESKVIEACRMNTRFRIERCTRDLCEFH